MMRKSLLKRGLLATAFVAAFAFTTVGTSSEASARHCGGGGYYSGHHSGGHYGGGHYGGSHRVQASYYSPRTVYYGGGNYYGHGRGHGSHYYSGHGHRSYGAYYGGRSGVSVSFGF